MTIRNGLLRWMTVTAMVVVLLAACGDKPEALLASARDYLAKDNAKAAIIQIKNVLQKDPGLPEARFLLGKALLQNGDPVGAELELRKAIDGKYPADEVVPLLAQALLSSGQATKLLSDLQKIELTKPEAKADMQTSVALAHAAAGQIDKARVSIDAALAIKADHVRAMLVKARLMVADNDVKGGLGLIDSVLAKDAKNFEAWKLKGDILSSQGNAEPALSAYRKAVDVRPDFAGAHAAIFGMLMKQSKADEAGTQLEAMKKVLPNHPLTLMAEAEYLYQKKEFKRALEVAQELLKVAPNNPKALYLAGAVHFQLNSLAQAEDNLSRALKQSPGATPARRMLAVIYLRTGQPAKALTVIEPMLDQTDSDSGFLSLAGDIYMQNGNPQKAEEYFSKAAALDPKSATKQTKIALTHLAEGKADAAFGELERIASADAGTTADMALIASSIKTKDFATAMKAIDGLEKKQPDNPLVHALRGAVLVTKGDVLAGRKSLEKALSVKPGYFPAAVSLASLDLKDNRPDDARKRFEGVLVADPKNVQASLALAELKARAGGSADEVVALIGNAIQASPNEPAPRLALINFHLQNKDAKKAVTVAQDAATALPTRVEILDALARAQQAIGDTNQALATCGKMASLMPGSPQPYLRMAEINVAAKNKESAIQNLMKALDLKPDLVAAQRGLILIYVDARNYQGAQKIANDVKQQRPKEALGYVLEGDIATARNAWADAVAAYRTGLKETGSTELAIKLYAALRATGNGAEADKFASGWISDHSRDSGFRLAVAESATARRDFPAAVRQYQVLLQTQPNSPVLLNNLAWVLGQLKDPKALEYAEKANRIAPNQASIMETLGSLLAERGETARALELLQGAVNLAPQSPSLKLSLVRVQVRVGKKAEARKSLDELSKLGDKFYAQAEVTKLLKEIGN